MLNVPDFRPSSRLLNLWICLPQNSISIRNNKVAPLFGKPKNFIFNYIFVIALILLEVFTIYTLSERGVSFTIMLILTIADFIIALIPLLLEQKKIDLCLSYINAHLFINKTKLKHTKPSTPESASLLHSVKDYKSKKNVIRFISFCVTMVIIGFGLWKFIIYFGIYRSKIWVNPAGRLVLVAIALGIFTHLTSTKVVCLDILVRIKKRMELKAKDEGNGEYIYNNDYQITPIKISTFKKVPVFSKYSNHQKLLKKLEQTEYKKMSVEEKKNCIEITSGGQIYHFRQDDTFSENAHLCYTQLLKDEELNSIITLHGDPYEKEIIACFGKEIQLTQM